MFSYHGTNGWIGIALCSSQGAATSGCGHWLGVGRCRPTGLQGQQAACHPSQVCQLWCWLSGSETRLLPGTWSRDGGVHFAVCIMLVMSCAPGHSLLSMTALFYSGYLPAALSALTMLDGWQEGHPACKN